MQFSYATFQKRGYLATWDLAMCHSHVVNATLIFLLKKKKKGNKCN